MRRKEISHKELASEEFRVLSSFPILLLRSWGFDPTKDVGWWDDIVKETRIFIQEE